MRAHWPMNAACHVATLTISCQLAFFFCLIPADTTCMPSSRRSLLLRSGIVGVLLP